MIGQAYAAVMDENVNPLQRLPRLRRFQVMTFLALLWSVVFCTWVGLMNLVGPSMGAHTVLLVGVFYTTQVFRHSEEGGLPSYDRNFKDPRDGCARDDDVWGG